MGKVKRAEAHPTRVDYYIDDDTGTIKCTLWKDQEQDKGLDHDDYVSCSIFLLLLMTACESNC